MIRNTDSDDVVEKAGEYAFLPERTCAICYQDQNSVQTEAEAIAASGVIGSAQTDITNPYETIPCGCIYCFVCLAGRLEAEEGEGWACLRCGEEVKECKPWSGDVLEEVTKSTSTSKTVVFTQSTVDLTEMKVMAQKQAMLSKVDESKLNDSESSSSENGRSEAYEEGEDGELFDSE